MAVHKVSYRRYEGPQTPRWSRFLILPSYAYRDIFQSKFFLVFFVVCFIVPLGASLLIYLRHNLSALQMLQIPADAMLPIDTYFFFTLMNIQGVFAFLMTVLLGPGQISPDLNNNALPLYLSKPFTKLDYVLGKLSVILILTSAITWVPLSLLYLLQASLAGPGWLFSNLDLLFACIVGALIWIVFLGLLALAISAWIRWRPVAGAMLFIIFFAAAAFGDSLNETFLTRLGDLISLNQLISRIWMYLFFGGGSEIENAFFGPEPLPVWAAALSLTVIAGLCLLLLRRKIEAYEVVR